MSTKKEAPASKTSKASKKSTEKYVLRKRVNGINLYMTTDDHIHLTTKIWSRDLTHARVFLSKEAVRIFKESNSASIRAIAVVMPGKAEIRASSKPIKVPTTPKANVLSSDKPKPPKVQQGIVLRPYLIRNMVETIGSLDPGTYYYVGISELEGKKPPATGILSGPDYSGFFVSKWATSQGTTWSTNHRLAVGFETIAEAWAVITGNPKLSECGVVSRAYVISRECDERTETYVQDEQKPEAEMDTNIKQHVQVIMNRITELNNDLSRALNIVINTRSTLNVLHSAVFQLGISVSQSKS